MIVTFIDISIYLLCALVALTCAVLLYRSWKRGRVRLLFWSWLCFAVLAVANLAAIADYMTGPAIDLYPHRCALHLLAYVLVAYGLAWETS